MKVKICTSLEQSKRLVELGLDSKTADMFYKGSSNSDPYSGARSIEFEDDYYEENIAWSLSRLLVIIRDYQCVWLGANDVASWVTEFNLGSGKHYTTDPTTDPLDAAYNCLVWLIENGKINPKNITI